MQTYARLFLAGAVALVSVGLWAQNQDRNRDQIHSFGANLLVRLSYSSSAVDHDAEGLRQICFAVSRDGSYRLLRLTRQGETERLRGKMAEEQLQKLKTLLGHSDFRALSGSHGGLILQGAESFGAEIPRENGTQHLRWLNPDGGSPFPHAVAKIVDWLEAFDSKGGEPFTPAEFSDVCPSEGFRLLTPPVAANFGR